MLSMTENQMKMKAFQEQEETRKHNSRLAYMASAETSKEKSFSPKENRNGHNPSAKQSNPSSTQDSISKGVDKKVEKVDPDPRTALMAMLSNRASLSGSAGVASIESIEEEDGQGPDPRTALASMLRKRAPAISPVDASKMDSSEQEVERNGLNPSAKQVLYAIQRDGLDPSIVLLDPEKSLACQFENNEAVIDKGTPLKDDPTYSKYFKMLKMVRNR